ncbi:MAG TPA: hypothetical protein P5081_16170 [Phycisphaerae bacterium]|nr:hypothetical protein [Phycisphaerae bacterium]HRW54407.1 hypothetical protein [Phycisphaerae bacterium]
MTALDGIMERWAVAQRRGAGLLLVGLLIFVPVSTTRYLVGLFHATQSWLIVAESVAGGCGYVIMIAGLWMMTAPIPLVGTVDRLRRTLRVGMIFTAILAVLDFVVPRFLSPGALFWFRYGFLAIVVIIMSILLFGYLLRVSRRFELRLPDWLIVIAMVGGVGKGVIWLLIYGASILQWQWPSMRAYQLTTESSNLLTATQNVAFVIALIQWRRKVVAGARGRCPACGYILVGDPERCVECGVPLSGAAWKKVHHGIPGGQLTPMRNG